MPVLTLINEGKTIEVTEGSNLRKVLLKNGIYLYTGRVKFINCLGNGLCGTCRVEIVDGKNAPPMTALEESSLLGLIPLYARSVSKNVRLSCRITVTKDISVKTSPVVTIDWKVTRERLMMVGIWTLFGGTLLAVLVRLLIEIATGK
jgi:ferredoxin